MGLCPFCDGSGLVQIGPDPSEFPNKQVPFVGYLHMEKGVLSQNKKLLHRFIVIDGEHLYEGVHVVVSNQDRVYLWKI